MSGTSLDGVDAALVDIRPQGNGYAIDLVAFETHPFERGLDERLRGALPPATSSVEQVALLHRDLGDAFGRAARSVAEAGSIDYVASHGQTMYHDGERSVTLQLGDPFRIRDATGVSVCYDFRSADCAAGGHGAPLIPHVDALLFGDPHEHRVALNIGGIANVTLLERGAGEPLAFDTGPGTMLLDALVFERSAGRSRFDRDGVLAASGRVDAGLLESMLSDSYFEKRPPKSTGRERFGAQFARSHPALAELSTEDAAATLTELTAASIARAIAGTHVTPARVIVSGGGAYNPVLLARLQARLGSVRVEPSDAMGVRADAKEAIAFAVLGYEALRGRTANVPRATGARRAVTLGAIAPCELALLLDRVARECALQ